MARSRRTRLPGPRPLRRLPPQRPRARRCRARAFARRRALPRAERRRRRLGARMRRRRHRPQRRRPQGRCRGLRRWGAGRRGRGGSAGGVSRCDSVRRDVRSASYGLAGLYRRAPKRRPLSPRPPRARKAGPSTNGSTGQHSRALRERHAVSFGENGFQGYNRGFETKTAKISDSPFSSLQFSGNKGPIDIKSDALDLDYKGNVVTFRGHVHAVTGRRDP